MQPTTNKNDVLNALSTLISQRAVNIPTPTIPALGFTAPSVQEMGDKWLEFLNKAATQPDIINYYSQLLEQAKGDTELAKSFLERDYQMGTRQTKENLQASLEELGLTQGKEEQALEERLNKRGIALTQDPSGRLVYAGGGQPQTEFQQMGEKQKLRREAEERSARQGIEKMGLTREKGLTTAGQNLVSKARDIQQAKEQEIRNAAGLSYGAYQRAQEADLQNKLYQQKKSLEGGGATGTGDSELQQLQKTNRNPVQETRYQQLLKGGI